MKLFEANVRVTRHERWTVEAIEIEGARRKFQLGTSDVKEGGATGELTDWEVYAVHEIPACTCGGEPGQPADHHDISCPAAIGAS